MTACADPAAIVARIIHRRAGLILGPDKRSFIEQRLAPLLDREGLADLHGLVTRLAGHDPVLLQDVIDALVTQETAFFRDEKTFAHLQAEGLPRLSRGRARPVRLWSAATATGQEAYSLAMIAIELGLPGVDIVATDIAHRSILRAQSGLFDQHAVSRGLSPARLRRFFDRHGEGWQVRPALRALCRFRCWNLLDDPAPLGGFDIVLCRNVLFYFDAATKARVLAGIVRQLAPDGLLYLGASETVCGAGCLLERSGPSLRLVRAA